MRRVWNPEPKSTAYARATRHTPLSVNGSKFGTSTGNSQLARVCPPDSDALALITSGSRISCHGHAAKAIVRSVISGRPLRAASSRREMYLACAAATSPPPATWEATVRPGRILLRNDPGIGCQPHTDQAEQRACRLNPAQRFSKDDRRDDDSRHGLQIRVHHGLPRPQSDHGTPP